MNNTTNFFIYTHLLSCLINSLAQLSLWEIYNTSWSISKLKFFNHNIFFNDFNVFL